MLICLQAQGTRSVQKLAPLKIKVAVQTLRAELVAVLFLRTHQFGACISLEGEKRESAGGSRTPESNTLGHGRYTADVTH